MVLAGLKRFTHFFRTIRYFNPSYHNLLLYKQGSDCKLYVYSDLQIVITDLFMFAIPKIP